MISVAAPEPWFVRRRMSFGVECAATIARSKRTSEASRTADVARSISPRPAPRAGLAKLGDSVAIVPNVRSGPSTLLRLRLVLPRDGLPEWPVWAIPVTHVCDCNFDQASAAAKVSKTCRRKLTTGGRASIIQAASRPRPGSARRAAARGRAGLSALDPRRRLRAAGPRPARR